MTKILVIDDERSIRNSMKDILQYEGHEVVLAENGMEGLVSVKSEKPDIVFCDIKMPKMEGIEVLERIKEFSADTPVIMISGHGTIDTAIEAIRKGAYDFIEKPLDLNRILITIKNATDKHLLIHETKTLKNKVSKKYDMIGNSEALNHIRAMIDKVAVSDARILVTGPNGSGKELVAHQLHELSHRKDNAFVEVNCAAIPSELIESELFGHEKGSFTSAIKQKKGNFREDLYHRLSVIIIDVPPLCQRLEDIDALANHFLTEVCTEMGIAPKTLSPDAIVALKECEWTGNIRELRNVVERLVILCGNTITREDVRMYR